MMPRFHTRRAIAMMIVAFLLQPFPFSPSAEEAIPPSPDPQSSRTFSDTKGHWAEAAIQKAVAAGIVKGYGDGTFRPDRPITYAEFVLMLHRSAIYAGDDWPCCTVGEPYPSGILDDNWPTGIPGGTGTAAGPDEPITRQAAATLMMKLKSQSPNAPGKLITSTAHAAFPDWTEIEDWATVATTTMISTGILTGHDDGLLRPNGILSRAEGATLFMRVLDSWPRSMVLDPLTASAVVTGSGRSASTASPPAPAPPQDQTPAPSQDPTPAPPQDPNPAPTPSSAVTTSHLRHLGNLISLETDASNRVTSFSGVTLQRWDESFLYEQPLVAAFQATAAGIDPIAITSNVAVWEAVLTASNQFDFYALSTLSAIAAGDQVSLYDTTSGAALGGKANLIIRHRENGEGYGVVLDFYSPDTEALVGPGTQPRLRLKTATGETRNYVTTGTQFGGLDLTTEEALSIHQLIQYHVNGSGEIDWLTPGAVLFASKYASFTYQGGTAFQAIPLNPDSQNSSTTTYEATSSTAVFVLDDGIVTLGRWDSTAWSFTNGASAGIFDRNQILALLDDASTPGYNGNIPGSTPDAVTAALFDEIMSDPAIKVLDTKPVLRMVVTAGGVDAASTIVTGADGLAYRINPDAVVYRVTWSNPLGAYVYERDNLFNIYPGMTLILYHNYILSAT